MRPSLERNFATLQPARTTMPGMNKSLKYIYLLTILGKFLPATGRAAETSTAFLWRCNFGHSRTLAGPGCGLAGMPCAQTCRVRACLPNASSGRRPPLMATPNPPTSHFDTVHFIQMQAKIDG